MIKFGNLYYDVKCEDKRVSDIHLGDIVFCKKSFEEHPRSYRVMCIDREYKLVGSGVTLTMLRLEDIHSFDYFKYLAYPCGYLKVLRLVRLDKRTWKEVKND